MKESFEFEIEGKTYVSKKMTPILRAKLMKVLPLAKFSALESKKGDMNFFMDLLSDTFQTIPELMWEFIKDDDKKIIGTYQKFLESLDENLNMILLFITWGMKKVEEITSFLEQTKPQVAKV